jgi:hypothetical protein
MCDDAPFRAKKARSLVQERKLLRFTVTNPGDPLTWAQEVASVVLGPTDVTKRGSLCDLKEAHAQPGGLEE